MAWTRVAAEWTGSRVETATATVAPHTWMIEGMQTMTPRWFAAGRLRRADAFSVPRRTYKGPLTTDGFRAVNESSREIVIGYRATPAVTLRAGYLVTRAYATIPWMHRGEASIVWAQRWR